MTNKATIQFLVIVVICFAARNALASDSEAANDILIIVNRNADVDSIDASMLRDIFLKKRTSWAVGTNIMPINAPVGSQLRKEFRRRIIRMSPTEESSYWQAFQVKAKGQRKPIVFNNAFRAVFRLENAIGYIYRSQFKSDLSKVVLVLPAAK